MKRKLIIIPVIVALLTLASCGTEELLNNAQEAVGEYAKTLEEYNLSVDSYNEMVAKVEEANAGLQDVLDKAQDVINKGEEPYNPETLEGLKTALADAGDAKVSVPELLEKGDKMSVPKDAKKAELESIIEKAKANKEEISAKIDALPDEPEIPDYSEAIATVTDAQAEYENSIQSLKQITAPTDKFVMERLQRIDTITAMAPVTEDHDPNGQLNKQGGYIGCIYFEDTQVDRSQLYIEEGGDNVIDIGTDGGGAIEIFATAEEAKVRDSYLAGFDGLGAMASGSHYVEGTCLIRTSNYLNGTQQKELTEKITKALIALD